MAEGANCAAGSASLGSVLLTSMLMESISYDASNGSLWLVKDTPIPCLKEDQVLIKVIQIYLKVTPTYISVCQGCSSWGKQTRFISGRG